MKRISSKFKFFLILTLVFSLSFFNNIQAQSNLETQDKAPEIKDFAGLRTEFKQYTQDSENKEAKFEMILKSEIDSDRVKITWRLTGAAKFVNENEAVKTLDIEKGKTYTLPIVILPTGQGVAELYGTAESVQVDSSFLVTVRKNFAINSESEILPLTQEYTNSKILAIVKNVLIITVIFGAIVGGGLFGFKRFVKWLNRDEQTEYSTKLDTKVELGREKETV